MLERPASQTGRRRFPRSARILRSVEYRELARRARRFYTGHFVVLYTRGSKSVTRTGITVSRKVGNAVVRNRVKRLVREIARLRTASLAVPMDLVFIARPGAGECAHREMDAEIGQFFAYLSQKVVPR